MSRKPARSTLEDVLPAQNARGDAESFNRHLMDLMAASQQGHALFDGEDELRFANTAFRMALGIGPDEFPTWADLMRIGYRNSTGTAVETADFELWLRSAGTRRGKLPYRTIETSLNDGRWMLTTETTLPGGWMLCVVTDISELGVELRDLRQERDRALKFALSDELTGLGNRRYVMDILNHRLGPNKAEALAVIIMDIDHFKSVNDRFGHACGDLVLKDFAARLSAAVARGDLVGRIGGEEFLLMLAGSRVLGVEAVMQGVLSSLAQASPLADMPGFRYSCSAGIAFANPGESASDVLRRADTALYEAKNTGRNRYVIYGADS